MNIIPKYASGGGFGAFFTTYKPVQVSVPQTSTSRSTSNTDSVTVKDTSKRSSDDDKDDSKGKLTEKDLFNMIKDVDGLPNEMKSIIKNLQTTLETEKLAGVDTGQLANNYLNTLYKLKVANQNKKKYDEALATAKENGSLGEAAITLSGDLMVQDKEGHVRELSLEEYQANRNNYQILTNSNIAWLRKYSPTTAFTSNDNSFEIISNGMGFEAFQKLLNQGKATLGESSYEEKGITGKEALAGLKMLQGKSDAEKRELLDKANGVISYDIQQESNIQQIQTLVQYLTAMLPKRAKVWAGVKLGTDEETASKALVQQYLMGSLKTSDVMDFSNKSSKSSDGSGGSGDSGVGLDKVDYNTPMKLLEGLGVQKSFVLSPGTTRATQVIANIMPITNNEDKAIGPNKTLQEAFSGNYSGILDLQNISIGGKIIPSSALTGIIAEDGQIASIDYPCIEKPNGEILPNTNPEVQKAKQTADLALRRNGIDVTKQVDRAKYYQVINKVYNKYKLGDAYNSNGEPIGNWRRFGVINVVANSRALNMDELEDNPMLREITDDATIDNLIEITKDEKFNKKGIISGFTGNYDRFYRGTAWIPLDVNYLAAATGTKTTGKDVRALQVNQSARDARSNWNTPPSI